ncbi:S1 family peptidase [Hellea balneolensis]|uniref:S1 family peptidase n=1 Tax=Hellea balneolensis TaxID=287478 RepID=UPI0004008ACD|nr:serine protease [Hellea balneolensis]
MQMPAKAQVPNQEAPSIWSPAPSKPVQGLDIRRHFYNERGFQCYASFFAHWGGWITAGHCLTETNDLLPPFANGEFTTWPDGLDAAIMGCHLPAKRPADPVIGQQVICKGFPAGARSLEERRGKVYFERHPGTWIAHIQTPDEPVVTGMSGGPVIDAASGEPVGVIITRNSPADLNNDRDPDESCDFIALSAVWDAVMKETAIS